MPTIKKIDALTHSQQETKPLHEGECTMCVVYMGETPAGGHLYRWHTEYNSSSGGTVLPIADENPSFNFETGNITVGGREFTTDGEEVFLTPVLPPPFEYLVHFDIRKWHQIYREHVASHGPFASEQEESNFLTCCECNAHSIPPERAAKALDLPIGQAVPWVGHFYLKPWELTEELFSAAVALTILRPNGDRIAVV